jgi:hypothetical protein
LSYWGIREERRKLPPQLSFSYKAISAVLNARVAQSGQIMRGQDDNGKFGVMLMKFHSSFKAVHLWHLKVHQDYLGMPPFNGGERLFTILGRGYDFKGWIVFKESTKRI